MACVRMARPARSLLRAGYMLANGPRRSLERKHCARVVRQGNPAVHTWRASTPAQNAEQS